MEVKLLEGRGGGLVFDPQGMMDDVTLDGVKVKVCKANVFARTPQGPQELVILHGDHEIVLIRLLHDYLALRERVGELEKRLAALEKPKDLDFAALAGSSGKAPTGAPPVDLGRVGPSDPMAPTFTPADGT